MSKLACKCGYTIIDQTDYLAFKARLVRDQDEESLFEKTISEAEIIRISCVSNSFEALLSKQYPKDLKISENELFHDKFSGVFISHSSPIYECVKCGRLWVQKSDSEEFCSFVSENNTYESVLKKC